jgi:Flp pilus assembly pilin Flp
MIRKFFADESGATAIEYGFVAGMVLLFAVGIASTGGSLTAVYQKVGSISAVIGIAGGGASPPPAAVQPPA